MLSRIGNTQLGQKNLLLAFDAFGTLYTPNIPIPQAYGRTALRHGVRCAPQKPEDQMTLEDFEPVKKSFGRAFKAESARNPNYGRATGLGAEKWWASVIKNTFVPFLAQNQDIPDALVSELLTRYSTQQGYTLFSDVIPFFNMLKDRSDQRPDHLRWPWERTVVGIISNSDDRVLSVLRSFGLKIRPQRVGIPGECRVQADMDDDITFIVLSYDAGFEKPDRRIFDAARQMLEKSIAKNCRSDGPVSIRDFTRLYVGDSLEHDYFGAKEAGWDAVLVDRSKGPPLEVDQNWQETSLPGLYREDRNVDGITKEVVTCDHLVSLAGWQPGELERMKKRVQKNS